MPEIKKPCPKTGPRAGKGKRTTEDFPEGFYAMVSRIEDLYILQSIRPVKVILPFSRKIAKQLLNTELLKKALFSKAGLPFHARDIILSLDPFFPQEKDSEFEEYIGALMEKSYVNFIVNNLGHFSLFRRTDEAEKAVLIAGPWLYAFNSWAWEFITGAGAKYNVSPLENNRQNLERTFPMENHSLRKRVFVTVFSRPALFRIRADLHKVYDFENFSGRKDETFRLTPVDEGTNVYPWEPFSILDKTPFLRKAGFTRFILDFSSGPLKKAEYRDIMEAAQHADLIPGASRFNWKNGFFHEPVLKQN